MVPDLDCIGLADDLADDGKPRQRVSKHSAVTSTCMPLVVLL